MLITLRKAGKMRIPEKAGRIEGKGVIHQYDHKRAEETCSLSAPRVFVQNVIHSRPFLLQMLLSCIHTHDSVS